MVPLIQSSSSLSSVLYNLGYTSLPPHGNAISHLGHLTGSDLGFTRKVNTNFLIELKKRLDTTLLTASPPSKLKLLQSVYPYRFQTATFRSIYTSLIHQLLQTPDFKPAVGGSPVVCGKVPIKILRMVKDGEVLGSRIWSYVLAARGEDCGADGLAAQGRDQRLLAVQANAHLTECGRRGRGVEGRVKEVLGRAEGVHGYVIDDKWDGGVRGNKGTEGFMRYAKRVNKVNENDYLNDENSEALWGELEGLLESVSFEVDVKVGKDTVRGTCLELVNSMMALDKQNTFLNPVENLVPGYRKVISEPMCYSDIKRNVGKGKYDKGEGEDGKWMGGIRRDFELVYDNCREFNKRGGRVWVEFANSQQAAFSGKFTAAVNKLKQAKRSERKRRQGNTVEVGRRDGNGEWANVLRWGQEITRSKRGILEAKAKDEVRILMGEDGD